MATIAIKANYYQQFDADFSRAVPAEGYGGWKKTEIDISREHTGMAVMHASSGGTREKFPGWHRAEEYFPRANEIARTVFPPLLSAARKVKLPVFHIAGGGDFYKKHPGYLHAVHLAGTKPEPGPEIIEPDPVLRKLYDFRAENVYPGKHNKDDIIRGAKTADFLEEAKPVDDEGIAVNGKQLFALCKEAGINHLIYAGFAINWCLLLSPGGMVDMGGRGVMCSAFRQAVTAVENKETARSELGKENGLWRVATAFGFVFDVDDFIDAMDNISSI